MTLVFILGVAAGMGSLVTALLITGAANTHRGRRRAAALPTPGQAGYEARVRALLTAPEWPVDSSRNGGAR